MSSNMAARLMLASLCLATLAPAISPAQDAPDTTQQPIPEDSKQQVEATASPDKKTGHDKDGTAEDRDPFDYKSSEEISEDLSVSFPVDI